jgi:triosephosphate isomerase
MNLSQDEAISLAEGIASVFPKIVEADIALFPPIAYLEKISGIVQGSGILTGAQNIHTEETGAFTGENSAKMVLTCGGEMVILGHSERRHIFGESDVFICEKVKRALSSGLVPVLCIGEKLNERDSGRTEKVLMTQLEGSLDGIVFDSPDKSVIAYEPVWAIGTGRNATPAQAQEAHLFIRGWLSRRYGEIAKNIRILYGGSVTSENCEELLSQCDVDGALVGGASLKKESFCKIISIAERIAVKGK